jgi:RNA polymerase sigma-70 factor, ECF subfamily
VRSVPDAQRRAAFERTVTEVYSPVLRYLRRRTDPTTADDILGDTLLVLWRRFDDVPPDNPVAYAIGVARGCLANRRRGDERQLRLVHRLATEPTAFPSADASSDDDLDAAFAALPEKDREVLRLWAWEQLPPRDLAVVLGISPNAASVRLHRATKRLRSLMDDARKAPAGAGHESGRQGREAR